MGRQGLSFFRELVREKRKDMERMDERIEELRAERQQCIDFKGQLQAEIDELQAFIDWKAGQP